MAFDEKAFAEVMRKVNAEFAALQILHKKYTEQPAVVDDEFPRWRHEYTSKLRAFLRAVKENNGEDFLKGL